MVNVEQINLDNIAYADLCTFYREVYKELANSQASLARAEAKRNQIEEEVAAILILKDRVYHKILEKVRQL